VKPTDSTSPAKAEPVSTQVRATAITNRFMDLSPLKVEDAKALTSGKIEQLPDGLASVDSDN
jgi:hypothetical protein